MLFLRPPRPHRGCGLKFECHYWIQRVKLPYMTCLNHLDISHRACFLKVSEEEQQQQQEQLREARIDLSASPQVKSDFFRAADFIS